MAGWSMIADGYTLDCIKTPQKLEPYGLEIDLESTSKGSDIKRQPSKPFEARVKGRADKLRCLFYQLLTVFLKVVSPQDSFRPLHPMLGEGQCVDLFKLFEVVREKGGYEAVSRNGLWDLIAKESGLDSNVASAVKLVYVKYLDILERWLTMVVKNNDSEFSLNSATSTITTTDFGGNVDLQAELKGLLSEISDKKKKDEVRPKLEAKGDSSFSVNDEVTIALAKLVGNKNSVVDIGKFDSELAKILINSGDSNELCQDQDLSPLMVSDEDMNCTNDKECLTVNSPKNVKVVQDDGVKSRVLSFGEGSKCGDYDGKDDDSLMILDSGSDEEDNSSRKRKRESVLGTLNWVTGIAKNPCDPVIGSLPEKSKWKSYGNEEIWKRVLLVREAIFLRRHDESSAEQSAWQKYQKMHPCMYDDHLGSGYKFRERLRCRKTLLSGKTACSGSSSSSTQNDLDKSPTQLGNPDEDLIDKYTPSRIPLGLNYQAKLPEWKNGVFESDLKWLGTRVWPLEKSNKFLIERDPIGKGRGDLCGCLVPGSIDCVNFHIAEKRYKLKLELGVAFHEWKFDKMGEEVALSWTEKEEKKFENIVRSNPQSDEKCFWDHFAKAFPKKTCSNLVSYYFNVFLLRRRGHQNRLTPSNIDSEDEESEYGTEPNRPANGARKST